MNYDFSKDKIFLEKRSAVANNMMKENHVFYSSMQELLNYLSIKFLSHYYVKDEELFKKKMHLLHDGSNAEQSISLVCEVLGNKYFYQKINSSLFNNFANNSKHASNVNRFDKYTVKNILDSYNEYISIISKNTFIKNKEVAYIQFNSDQMHNDAIYLKHTENKLIDELKAKYRNYSCKIIGIHDSKWFFAIRTNKNSVEIEVTQIRHDSIYNCVVIDRTLAESQKFYDTNAIDTSALICDVNTEFKQAETKQFILPLNGNFAKLICEKFPMYINPIELDICFEFRDEYDHSFDDKDVEIHLTYNAVKGLFNSVKIAKINIVSIK